PGASQTEVSERRTAECALEHQRERGWVLVTEIDGNGCHRFACGKARHRGQEAGLLPPRLKAQAGFAPEETRERAAAHAQRPAPIVDGVMDARPLDKAAAALRQRAVRRV